MSQDYSGDIKIAGIRLTKEKEYWQNKLSGELVTSYFPHDHVEAHASGACLEKVNFKVADETFEKLMKVCRNSDVNLHMFLVAAATILLHRYTGNQDIILATPIYKQEVEGEFINTVLVLRNRLGEGTFKSFLMDVRKSIIEAVENQNYPIHELIGQLDILPSPDGHYLFDAAVVLENLHDRKYLSDNGLNIVFSFCKMDAHIEGTIEYNAGLYKKSTIERIGRHYSNILAVSLENSDTSLTDMEILTDSERQQLLSEFNNTEYGDGWKERVSRLFEEQACENPDAVALIYKEFNPSSNPQFVQKQMTYGELNIRANRLARFLVRKGVKPNQIVGLMVKRSLEMVVGMLGIMKAGGAFLPIDSQFPVERIKYMSEDSGMKILLTQSQLSGNLDFGGEIVCLDDPGLYTGDGSNLEEAPAPEDLAYIIYTSGTTGRPKAVMIEHRGIANTIGWRRDEYKLSPRDRMLQLFSFTFDGFLTSFLTPIVSGAAVVLPTDEESKDLEAICSYIVSCKVTHFICVPTLYNEILDYMTPEQLKGLRVVTLAGEKVGYGIIKKSKSRNPHLELANEYGPTENSVASTILRDLHPEKDINIGRPIRNTQIYILDTAGRLQPIGVSGELCISGRGLAKGYLNNPGQTSEKFTQNPFIPGQRMYKTGDLARWQPDGTIEFIGRIDHQVKVRGFRIEIEEIENWLTRHEAVKEAVVIAKEDDSGKMELWAYVVPDTKLTISELREFLLKELPDYMIPSHFVSLEKMPLTPNGKLDRHALVQMKNNMESGMEYLPPRNEIEEKMAKAWKEVLGVESVGINDNFFTLGGDSIKAIQVLARLNNYHLKVEMKDLFQYPIISQLSAFVKVSERKVEQGLVIGQTKMTPVQKWFFEKNFTDMHHFNQSVMLFRKEGFDKAAVEAVFNKIVEHHDALRMVYRLEEGSVVQMNRGMEEELFTLDEYDFSGMDDYARDVEKAANAIQSSINLSTGPLVKLGLFKTCDGDHLLIVIHHLLVDGVSWRILFEDFATGYKQALGQEPISFKDKTDAFKTWADSLYECAEDRELLKEIDYWREVENSGGMPLPGSLEIENCKLKNSSFARVSLSIGQTEMLLKGVNQAYNTNINDILLTALGLTFKEWSGNDKVLVELEGHGREDIAAGVDISRTVGWFTSAYPVVLDMSSNADLSYIIKSVKENIRRIPNRGIGYGILKYITTNEDVRRLQFNLKPGVGFNYLGQFDSDIDTKLFTFSQISSGAAMSPEAERLHIFDISGMIVNGMLTMDFSYDKYQFDETAVQQLAELYKKNLVEIINHCTAKEVTELTPTDLGNSELSIEDLEEIKNMMGDL